MAYSRLWCAYGRSPHSTSYGCSLRYYVRLQPPLLRTVAASATYGCSLRYLRLQVYRSWAYWRYGGPVAQLRVLLGSEDKATFSAVGHSFLTQVLVVKDLQFTVMPSCLSCRHAVMPSRV